MVTASDYSWDSPASLQSDQSETQSSKQLAKQLRGVRGATTVERDDVESILTATKELLTEILQRNAATKDDVVSVFFTVTSDLHAEFPARAARELGWDDVAMLCGVEMDVPNALPRCIRVLLHMTLPGERSDVRHVYLREAEKLRPDLR
jgi:chorismate mutase